MGLGTRPSGVFLYSDAQDGSILKFYHSYQQYAFINLNNSTIVSSDSVIPRVTGMKQ